MNLFPILAQGYQKPIKQTMERTNRELLAVNNNLLKYKNCFIWIKHKRQFCTILFWQTIMMSHNFVFICFSFPVDITEKHTLFATGLLH